MLTFNKYLFCARFQGKCFTCVLSLLPFSILVSFGLVSCPFTDEDTGVQKNSVTGLRSRGQAAAVPGCKPRIRAVLITSAL